MEKISSDNFPDELFARLSYRTQKKKQDCWYQDEALNVPTAF